MFKMDGFDNPGFEQKVERSDARMVTFCYF